MQAETTTSVTTQPFAMRSDSPERTEAISVLFVCLGNICRSPSAEGIFRRLCQNQALDSKFFIDSAAIADYHIGKAPDPRAIEAMKRFDIDISTQKARHVCIDDFEVFDYIFGMDPRNIESLKSLSPPEYHHKIRGLTEVMPQLDLNEVADPYRGIQSDFDDMNALLIKLCSSALKLIQDFEAERNRATANNIEVR